MELIGFYLLGSVLSVYLFGKILKKNNANGDDITLNDFGVGFALFIVSWIGVFIICLAWFEDNSDKVIIPGKEKNSQPKHKILQKLDRYLENASEEDLKADWEYLKQFNEPSEEELLHDNIFTEDLRIKNLVDSLRSEISKKCSDWFVKYYANPDGEYAEYANEWVYNPSNPDVVEIMIHIGSGEETQSIWVNAPILEVLNNQ